VLIRLLSALIGLPILLALVWIGSLWFSLLVAIAGALAAIELTSIARRWGHIIPGLVITPPVVALIAVAYSLSSKNVMLPPLITLAIAVSSVALLIWLVAGRGREIPLARTLTALAIILYVGGFLLHVPLLRALEQGREWVLFLLLVTFATDTAAYFVGRSVGRTPLAPSISPSKTWEGSVGGMLGAVGMAVLANFVLGLNVLLIEALILGLLIGVVGQLGDLAESRIKRLGDVKDSGTIIPGHGGLLDRLDSIVLNVLVVYYFVIWEVLQSGLLS
jgi:phosphatidate cytidylyltransferase